MTMYVHILYTTTVQTNIQTQAKAIRDNRQP